MCYKAHTQVVNNFVTYLQDECTTMSYEPQNYERPKSMRRSVIDVNSTLDYESTKNEKPKDARRSSVVLISDEENDGLRKSSRGSSRQSLKSNQDDDDDDNNAHQKSTSSMSSAQQGNSAAVFVEKDEVKRWSSSPVYGASDEDEESNCIPYEGERRKSISRVDTTPEQRRSFIHTNGSSGNSLTPVFSVQKEEMMFSPHRDLPLVSWRSVVGDDKTHEVDQPVENVSQEATYRRRRRSSAQPPLLSLAGKILSGGRQGTPAHLHGSPMNTNRSAHKPNLASIEVFL